MLYKHTRKPQYKTDAENFVGGAIGKGTSCFPSFFSSFLPPSTHPPTRPPTNPFIHTIKSNAGETPKGLAYWDQWGSNRYAANAAFIALVAADYGIHVEVRTSSSSSSSSFSSHPPYPKLTVAHSNRLLLLLPPTYP